MKNNRSLLLTVLEDGIPRSRQWQTQPVKGLFSCFIPSSPSCVLSWWELQDYHIPSIFCMRSISLTCLLSAVHQNVIPKSPEQCLTPMGSLISTRWPGQSPITALVLWKPTLEASHLRRSPVTPSVEGTGSPLHNWAAWESKGQMAYQSPSEAVGLVVNLGPQTIRYACGALVWTGFSYLHYPRFFSPYSWSLPGKPLRIKVGQKKRFSGQNYDPDDLSSNPWDPMKARCCSMCL